MASFNKGDVVKVKAVPSLPASYKKVIGKEGRIKRIKKDASGDKWYVIKFHKDMSFSENEIKLANNYQKSKHKLDI